MIQEIPETNRQDSVLGTFIKLLNRPFERAIYFLSTISINFNLCSSNFAKFWNISLYIEGEESETRAPHIILRINIFYYNYI